MDMGEVGSPLSSLQIIKGVGNMIRNRGVQPTWGVCGSWSTRLPNWKDIRTKFRCGAIGTICFRSPQKESCLNKNKFIISYTKNLWG